MQKVFKSIWFKCISILLAILLISGGLLAILSDVLFVSAEERTKRSIKKIYGSEKEYSVVLDKDSGNSPIIYDIGSIEKIYEVDKIDDNDEVFDLLFKSTGYQGYKNGTITVWVRVSVINGEEKIAKVILESYEKQTLMSKLTSKFYDNFLIDITDNYDAMFTPKANEDSENKNIVSGATKSATAGCNAVNCVLLYLGGEQ